MYGICFAVCTSPPAPALGGGGGVTVMLQVAVTVFTSFDVTVIIATPSPTAVTFPPSSIVTTTSLLLVHVIVLSPAFSGNIVAVIISVSPTSNSIFVLSNVIDVTFGSSVFIVLVSFISVPSLVTSSTCII